jgi:hypothetical protein
MGVIKAIACASLCTWFSSVFVWLYFDANRSRVARPESGRIFPLNTHGSVVYLTAGEHHFLYGLMSAAVFLFLIAVLLDFMRRKDSRVA